LSDIFVESIQRFYKGMPRVNGNSRHGVTTA